MRVLLDTCVVLWYFAGSMRIPDPVRDALTDSSNDVFVSDVSALEVVIKYKLGKLSLVQPPSRFWGELVARHEMETLSLDIEDIFGWQDLPLLHGDPFDRLLIAQAVRNSLRLISPDPLIQRYDVPVWWG